MAEPNVTNGDAGYNVCGVGEEFYMAIPTFEWEPGVQIYHSRNLKDWSMVSCPLVAQFDMRGTPDFGGVHSAHLSHHAGRFWLVYSDVKVVRGAFMDCHNYLVTCETIDGQWSAPIFLNSSGFDPCMFHDNDGTQYLINTLWDHREHNRGIYRVALQQFSNFRERLVGTPKIIFESEIPRPHLRRDAEEYCLSFPDKIVRSGDITGPYRPCEQVPLVAEYPRVVHPAIDNFDGKTLSAHFQSPRMRLDENITNLVENPGHLRIYGRESLASPFVQAHVAYHRQGANFDAATSVTFAPESFQQMAGLSYYTHTNSWTSLHITHDEDKGRVIDIVMATDGEFAEPLREQEIVIPEGTGRIHLKLCVRDDSPTFLYSFDDCPYDQVNWKKIPLSFDAGDCLYVGVFCMDGTYGMSMGDGIVVQPIHADFDYFAYHDHEAAM